MVSPDGSNVYVASEGYGGSGPLAIFDRSPSTGAVVQKPGQAGCLGGGRHDCGSLRATGPARSVAMSPDGRSVYLAGSSVAVLGRDWSVHGVTSAI